MVRNYGLSVVLLFCLTFSWTSAQERKPVLLDSVVVRGSEKWWNADTQLNPLRLPPPPDGVETGSVCSEGCFEAWS